MLKVFRQKGVAKKILWVVSVLIILSFAFGFSVYQATGAGRQNAAAGKVFGKTIGAKEFQSYALAVRDYTMLTTGADFKKVAPFIDMDQETWTRILLVAEADRRGIKVTDREVIANVSTIPAFQRNGSFDKALYNSILANVFRREARDFEEGLRDQLKIAKLIQSSVGRVNIPEEKIKTEYERRNRKVQAGYVLLDPKQFAQGMNVNDADLQAYYDSHREEFLTPEAIKLQYVTLPLNEKTSLEEHKAAQEKAKTIFESAFTKGDLTSAAKANGAELRETGFFNMNNPDLSAGLSLELMSQAFAAKAGSVLTPSTTPNGITIIKIAERQPARILAFAEAKEQAKEKLLTEKTTFLATQKAEEAHEALLTAAMEKADLAAAARSAGLTPKETPFFAVGAYVPEIGLSEDFETAAMNVSESAPLSGVIQTAKGPVILWLKATQPADPAKFEETKKEFSLSLYREENTKAISAVVQDIRKRAKMETY